MITATAYDIHVEKLFDRMRIVHQALSAARLPYRIVGGMAVFMQVADREPDRARLTKDVDVGVNRADLDKIGASLRPYGFVYRHVAGVDMFVDAEKPKAHTAIHLVFLNERVRPEDLA